MYEHLITTYALQMTLFLRKNASEEEEMKTILSVNFICCICLLTQLIFPFCMQIFNFIKSDQFPQYTSTRFWFQIILDFMESMTINGHNKVPGLLRETLK